MTIGRGFRRLADLIDSIEATNVEITDVTVPDGGDDGALLADIQVRIPPDGNGSVALVETTNVSGDTASESVDETTGPPTNGGVDGPTDEPTAHSTNGATDERRNVSEDDPDDRALEATADDTGTDVADESGGRDGIDGDDEQVACRAEGCEEVFDTEHGMKIHHTKTHGLSADGEAPAYRDPDVLREVYAEYDSFTEMTDALGVDVAPQTVRRNMIKHGIHDPNAPDGDPETGEESTALPDAAVDLPGGTTLDDVKAAVASADTLYEVQQALDLERDQATDLLRELGLLELVHGRVATKHRRDDLKDEIDERLRNSATSD